MQGLPYTAAPVFFNQGTKPNDATESWHSLTL